MQQNFQIDVTAIETVLRISLLHGCIIYDEEETIRQIKNNHLDPIFPFTQNEWEEFVALLNEALIFPEFQISVYGADEFHSFCSTVANISLASSPELIEKYMSYLC